MLIYNLLQILGLLNLGQFRKNRVTDHKKWSAFLDTKNANRCPILEQLLSPNLENSIDVIEFLDVYRM
jgi:hypothetical protein